MFWVKAFISGLIVATAASISKSAPKLGALIVALPIVSLLTMSVMWYENTESEKIASHSEGTFWLVLPSLPMFLVLPWLLRSGWSYWPALGLCIVGTTALYLVMRQLLGWMP